MHTFAAFFTLLLGGVVSASPLLPKRATVCNGHTELCGRSYGNTTFLGSHDSFAVDKSPLNFARDQEVDVTAQLNLGVRLLQAQSHMWKKKLHFCHTSKHATSKIISSSDSWNRLCAWSPALLFSCALTRTNHAAPIRRWNGGRY